MRGNSPGRRGEPGIRFQRIQTQLGINMNSARFFFRGVNHLDTMYDSCVVMCMHVR